MEPAEPLAALACFFPVLVIQLAMSGVRQASAVGMLMVAVAFFLQGMRVATALSIIAGSFFHTSVIIFLPMAYLAGKKFNVSRTFVGTLLLGPVVYYFLESRMDVYVDRYVEEIYGEMSAFGAVFRYALLAISAGLFFVYREKVEKRFPDYFPLFMLFAMITLAILPLGLVNTVILHRVIYFVMPVSILMMCLHVDRRVAEARADDAPALSFRHVWRVQRHVVSDVTPRACLLCPV